MSIIYRSVFNTLWITLQSNETLGILDSDYVEDFFGNDGQVSLYHIAADTHYPLVMIEVPAETPEIPHDVFIGQTSLAGLPDGVYQVRGRVRDQVGNYSIISAFEIPLGGEKVVSLGFTIEPGSGVSYSMQSGGLLVKLGLSFEPGLTARSLFVGALKTPIVWSLNS